MGGGPAGYLAAERAGALGKRVLLVEKDQIGGVCLNEGCVPTKTLLYGAKLYHQARESATYATISAPRWPTRPKRSRRCKRAFSAR